MFEQFLDETMSYSSALFDPETLDAPVWSDLATAQVRKIERLLDQAGVGEGTRVLEIGTGWGELAIRAAHRGATVHSVTLSKEQQALARERSRRPASRTASTVELQDYREVRRTVRRRRLGRDDRGGRLRVLADVLPDPRRGPRPGRQGRHPGDHHAARPDAGHPQHVHLGAQVHLPGRVPALDRGDRGRRPARTRRCAWPTGSRWASTTRETLRLWDERFVANAGAVGRLGFDAIFRRMWHFYLEYSRAGFASGYLDVQQIVLRREGITA